MNLPPAPAPPPPPAPLNLTIPRPAGKLAAPHPVVPLNFGTMSANHIVLSAQLGNPSAKQAIGDTIGAAADGNANAIGVLGALTNAQRSHLISFLVNKWAHAIVPLGAKAP